MDGNAPLLNTRGKPKLLDQVREVLRLKHYSLRTEEAYVDWIKRFILHHGKTHPKEMGEEHVAAFLTWLAVERKVAASTQNQALSALLFLYGEVLKKELDFIQVERVQRAPKVPVVFTKEEARAVRVHLKGDYWMMGELLYGSGLRLMECVRLLAHLPASASPGRRHLGGSKMSISATIRW